MFSEQHRRNFAGQSAQDLPFGVDQKPFPMDVGFFRDKSLFHV
jgi:hypothetical protein